MATMSILHNIPLFSNIISSLAIGDKSVRLKDGGFNLLKRLINGEILKNMLENLALAKLRGYFLKDCRLDALFMGSLLVSSKG